MKVLEIWFTPHCIDNLVSFTLITIETNFNIDKVKKNVKMLLPHPSILKSVKKNKANSQKNYFEKTNRATGLKSWSFLPITIPHNQLYLWYDSLQTFLKIYFDNQFWSFQVQFQTYLPCTSQWGKFSSSRLCIFDFRNEMYTKFQSRKHFLFYILTIFIFSTLLAVIHN